MKALGKIVVVHEKMALNQYIKEGGDTVIKAYILVSLVPGLESHAIPQISVLPGVQETDLVFGRWDMVVQVESKSIPDLSQMVINQIRGLQGVQTTETLIGGVI